MTVTSERGTASANVCCRGANSPSPPARCWTMQREVIIVANPILEQRFLGRIVPGMDVCDVGGDKIGSVSHIHRFSELPDPANPSEMPEEYLELKTGFLGFGKHLYVPMSAVQEVLTDSLYVNKAKEEVEQLGWTEKPAHLAEVE